MIYLDLFLTFFKIGAFTFGGGYAMLPFVQQEVLAHGWMSLTELVDFIAVSESTPGPFAVNVATYVGSHVGGLLGAFMATGGVILPSFLIILLVARIYKTFEKSRVVAGVMTGLRPAVVGLIAAAVLSVGRSVFPLGGGGRSEWIFSALIFLLSCYAILKRKWSPIRVIVLSAGAGIVCGCLGLI